MFSDKVTKSDALAGPYDDISIHPECQYMDYEVRDGSSPPAYVCLAPSSIDFNKFGNRPSCVS